MLRQLSRSSSFEKHTSKPSALTSLPSRPLVRSNSSAPSHLTLAIMAPKAAPTHAPYVDMIKAAVVALKDRNGSSLPALKKKIGECLSYRIKRRACCCTCLWLLVCSGPETMSTSNTAALSLLAISLACSKLLVFERRSPSTVSLLLQLLTTSCPETGSPFLSFSSETSPSLESSSSQLARTPTSLARL